MTSGRHALRALAGRARRRRAWALSALIAMLLAGLFAMHGLGPKGAVAMARTEESEGSDKAAKAMARDIRRTQTEEITKMRGLLEK